VRLDAFENFIRGVAAGASADKVRYLKAALAIDPNYAQASLLLGKTYFAARDYDQAAATLAKVPADDAAFAQASFFLGLSEFHLGHFEKAGAAFRATAERVLLTEVLNNIGAAESRRGRRNAADYFRKAVKADPSDPDYHFNLAIALYRAGDAPAAQRQLREALRLRPGDTEARKFDEALLASPAPAIPLSRIKQNYDESSYRQLAVELQNAIDESIRKAKPAARASLHLERARELLANGAAREAESQFRESLTQDPGNPDALAGLAHALLLENRFAEARKQAQAAIAVEPSQEAYLVIARAALHDHDRAAAGQNLQKALALGPADDETKAVAQEIQNQAAEDAPAERP
jgi:tetratricopeptide (TPR) repeat protein